jgi:hypothetical protein
MTHCITMRSHTISFVNGNVINILEHNVMINKPNILLNVVNQLYILSEISKSISLVNTLKYTKLCSRKVWLVI